MAEGFDLAPLRFGVRLGDAGRFENSRDAHFVREFAFALVDRAGDRRGVGRKRAAGERNMAFTGEQPRGRIKTDPAGAGQINFAPGVEISEIVFGAGRAVERFYVSGKLNQVARNKT